MRKQLLGFVLGAIVLVGCSAQTPNYEESVHSALMRPLPYTTNRNKSYFSYYLLPNSGVKEATQVSTYYTVEGNPVMIDLDVPNVIGRFYEQLELDRLAKEKEVQDEEGKAANNASGSFNSIISEDKTSYRQSGTYIDGKDVERHFVLSVIDLGAKQAIVLENGQIRILTVVRPSDADMLIQSMFTTMRSVSVNEDLVVKDFSKKDINVYQERYENFFEHAIPENGTIQDIMEKSKPSGNQ